MPGPTPTTSVGETRDGGTVRLPRLSGRPFLVAPPVLHLHAAGTRRPPLIREPVSVLLPLRHGPSVALAAVRAAVAQRNLARLDVVVLDVGCTEETYRVLSREFRDDPRVRLLDTSCLPSGWSRFSHRCQQLAVGARGRILLFADPAAPLGPYAAAAGADLLRREELDLVVLDAGGARRTGRYAFAADAEAYWRIGGHRAAASHPHPLALLCAMRKAHVPTGLADARRVIPAHLRARAEELPPEPPEPYSLLRDYGDSTLGSLGTTARKLLAAMRAAGLETAGGDEAPGGQGGPARQTGTGQPGQTGQSMAARGRAGAGSGRSRER